MTAPKKTTLGRSSGGLPRYYLDVGWWRHRRFAGLDPATLFVVQAAISYGNEHGSDGHMPADLEDLSIALGIRVSVLKKAAPLLVSREIWSKSGSEFVVRDWSQHNPTRGEIDDLSAERSKLGVRGNHVRWHVERQVRDPECPFCAAEPEADPFASEDRPGDPVSDPFAIANASPEESQRNGRDGMGDLASPKTQVVSDEGDEARVKAAVEIHLQNCIRDEETRKPIGSLTGFRSKRLAEINVGQLERMARTYPSATAADLAAFITNPAHLRYFDRAEDIA